MALVLARSRRAPTGYVVEADSDPDATAAVPVDISYGGTGSDGGNDSKFRETSPVEEGGKGGILRQNGLVCVAIPL